MQMTPFVGADVGAGPVGGEALGVGVEGLERCRCRRCRWGTGHARTPLPLFFFYLVARAVEPSRLDRFDPCRCRL
jgi:hypothetical protein